MTIIVQLTNQPGCCGYCATHNTTIHLLMVVLVHRLRILSGFVLVQSIDIVLVLQVNDTFQLPAAHGP